MDEVIEWRFEHWKGDEYRQFKVILTDTNLHGLAHAKRD